MQYGEIIKSAWRITWRYKNLWWLGLFAGAGGASARFNSSNFNSSSFPSDSSEAFPSQAFAEVGDFLVRFWPLILAGTVLVLAIWLTLLILQVAATGGLISQVDVAESGAGRVSAMTGWGDGFHRWWPLAILGFFVALPTLIVLLLVSLALFVVVAVPLYAGGEVSFGGVLAVLFVFIGFMLILIPVNIVLSVLGTIGQRGIMLAGQGPWQSLVEAWQILRTRFKDVALTWLIVAGIGIGFAVVLLIATLIIVGVIVALFLGMGLAVPDAAPVLIGLGVIVGLFLAVVFAVIGAAYATFHSAVWTLFWRRVTGRQPIAAQVPPATMPPGGWQQAPAGPPMAPPMAPVAPQAPAPPMPPTAPQPTAPPMAPQPPAPPVAPPAPPMAPPAAPQAPIAPEDASQ